MSVFTQLTLVPRGSRHEVRMARPWFEPGIRHETHRVQNLDGTSTLFLRVPFYAASRPRIGESVNLQELLDATYP